MIDPENKNTVAVINDSSVEKITPELIAELFCALDSKHQARFFNHVADVAQTWKGGINMQLQYLTDEDGLTLSGRMVMADIGNYSHWGLRPDNHPPLKAI